MTFVAFSGQGPALEAEPVDFSPAAVFARHKTGSPPDGDSSEEVGMHSSEILKDQIISCDFCGKKHARREIIKTKDFIYLCFDCFRYLETLPEKVKEDIKERLSGNVV